MNARDFISKRDEISLSEFSKNYEEIKNNLGNLQNKARDIDTKYDFNNLLPDQIPEIFQEIQELLDMIK